MMDDLREYLVRRREQLGLSQTALARAMGTAQSAVSELENGLGGVPNLATLAKWASALDVELRIEIAEVVHRSFPVDLGGDE